MGRYLIEVQLCIAPFVESKILKSVSSIYQTNPFIKVLPPLKDILIKDSLKGYKLKYNVNDTYYYMGLDSILPDKCIQRIYPYQIYEKENYKVDSIPPRVIYKGDLYIQN